jgi:hypothetical protein
LKEGEFASQIEIISTYQVINQEYRQLVKNKTGKEENLNGFDNNIPERERESKNTTTRA